MLFPWAPLLAAARHRSRDRPAARFAQLATVGEGGFPHCRTVVIRAVDEQAGTVSFTTDDRSAKVAELAASPRAEICWYFEETREQFRLAGSVSLLRGEEAPRQALWSSLSPGGRASFSWPEPGTPREDGDRYPLTDGSPVPPASFVACVLAISEIDYVSLHTMPHERRRWRKKGKIWEVERIRP